MRKTLCMAMACFSAATAFSQSEILLPHGFVTYSRGEDYNRVLCRAEIRPGWTFEQIHATEQPIVEKGPHGGDITNQISFDGKWVAFSRSLPGTDDGSGGNNYADFGKWDIYIARVDGKLPVKPIRIGHGFFPSWGEDSSKSGIKTLYFSRHEERAVYKVRIDDKGNIVEKETRIGQVPKEGYEGFIFAAPNGQFCAYRKSGAVYTYWWDGPHAGKSILMTGGCHPHVTADSKWVYHANRNPVRSDGSARGEAGAGGLYHYGSSNDLNWFVTRTEGDNTIINKGRESWLCTLYETETRFDTEKAVKISDQAGFIDIHVYDNKASKKAATNNRKRKEKILSGTLMPQEMNQAYKGLSKDMLEKLPVNKLGETFRWENNTADSRIVNHKGEFLRSCRLIPQGRAFLGKNGRMHLAGGHFVSDDQSSSVAMVEAAKFTNQFTVELQFVSHNLEVSGPARIASCSQDWSKRDWTIGQEKNQLMLRIRTRTNGENGSNTQISLGEIEAGKPYHLIVSYTPGYTLWSLNGKIGMNHNITDKIDNWQPYTLIFGNEHSGERNWYGEIQGVHTYAYAFSVKDMNKRYKAAQNSLKTMQPEKGTTVVAEIIENSADPSTKQLKEQGYYRCLTTRHMRVVESDNAELAVGKEFILKEWSILGLENVNSRKQGDKVKLNVFPAEKHKELQNEYTVEGLSVFDLPIYYSSEINTYH